MQRLKAKTQMKHPTDKQVCRQEHNFQQPVLGEIECGIQPVIAVMCTKCGISVSFKPIQQRTD